MRGDLAVARCPIRTGLDDQGLPGEAAERIDAEHPARHQIRRPVQNPVTGYPFPNSSRAREWCNLMKHLDLQIGERVSCHLISGRAPWVTFADKAPMPSMRARTRSPARMRAPFGQPVEIRSPGSSVMKSL